MPPGEPGRARAARSAPQARVPFLLLVGLLGIVPAASAQPVIVEYADDFQSYKTPSNVPGWVDSAIGSATPEAKGLFKAWPDPSSEGNVVFGTKQSSGKQGGRSPRIGTFSTLIDRGFVAKGRFEFRGRLLRTSDETRIGVTFLSSYPEADRYYLAGLWRDDESQPPTMRLFAFGGGVPSGALDSSFTPAPGTWTRFLIQADDVDGATRIRARFWPEGSPEPESFSIEAVDAAPSRLTTGRIGIWAAVKGEAYVDDLHAKAPVDTTPPAIRFTGPADGAVVATPSVRVTGDADDAVWVTVNGFPALIDAEARTFVSTVELDEGENAVVAEAADEVGNRIAISMDVARDTRAPEIALATPAAGACLDVGSLTITGTVVEPHLQAIRARDGDAFAEAVVDPRTQTWAATLPVGEGERNLTVEAVDTLGHRRVAPFSVVIDRTPPAIEIETANGPAVDGVVSRRALSFFASVRDLDHRPDLRMRLGAEPYVQGTPVATDGSYALVVAATDCAGHRTSSEITFTIDTAVPVFGAFVPPSGERVGSAPASVSGEVSADAVSVVVADTSAVASPVNGRFTVAGMTFVEGENRLTLRAADRAGNVGEAEYRVTVVTKAPSIEILEGGAPIPDGALFNRVIRPEIRVTDRSATSAITLNGAPFVPGTAIEADGSYALAVEATDELGHAASSRVAFIIDRTPPVVTITTPHAGRVEGATAEVEGAAGDSASVAVNGRIASLAEGSFTATVPLEEGDNVLVAIGTDAAGNSGRAEVVVVRDSRATGVLITFPPDGYVTTRNSVRVTGRVLDPGSVAGVTLGEVPVPVDGAGAFEATGFPLMEGENAITATATSKNGATAAASVVVVADRTPPLLRILESGRPLSDEARFAESAALSLEVSDERALASSEARIDGTLTALPVTVTASGGHIIVAVAVDAAGNETRVERTFFVGGATPAEGCRLESFIPVSGSVIAGPATGLAGRTGGATGVTVNGVPAAVASGSFCATVELPVEGANEIEIACTDSEGKPLGEPERLTLVRSTAAPSVSIDTPAEGARTGSAAITVRGMAGAAVVEVSVNGATAAIENGDANAARPFSIEGVRLVPGLNVITVRARTAGGVAALATRRVLYLEDPPSLTITSPLPGQELGSTAATLSGLWRGIDPSTLAIAGSAASPRIAYRGDRSGSFAFDEIALQPGESTLTVSGRDVLGRETTATVAVTRNDAAPSVRIVAPSDHAMFSAGATSLDVAGTAIGARGARIEVNGEPATIVSTETVGASRERYSFSSSVPFATLAATPLVARVTEPDGKSAYHAIRASRAAAGPSVERVFPETMAIGVDSAAMVVVVFSSPMDPASLRCGHGGTCGFRLEGPGGSLVSGMLDVDGDAITFAPAAPLQDGGEYTIRLTAAARDAAGAPLAADYESRFRIGLASAPSSAPLLDPLPARHCGSTLRVVGSAPPGARVQVDVGSSKFTATADALGRFDESVPLTGEAGYLLVRARTAAGDGTLSAATHSCVLVDCGGLAVSSAAYDRSINILTISFTAPVDLATATGDSISLVADGTALESTIVSAAPATLRVTPSEDLTQRSFTLEIATAIRSTDGTPLSVPFSQRFPFEADPAPPGDGTGFVAGEIYDAATGRPLAGATITVASPANAFEDDPERAVATSSTVAAGGIAPKNDASPPGPSGERSAASGSRSDARGRYAFRLAEGAHTLHVTGDVYTTAWRQVVVSAGAGVTPIDIRLARRAAPETIAALPATLRHGGDAVVADAVLEIPSGGAGTGTRITFTSVGAQSLAGLLPLGWSPLGSAEIVAEEGSITAATLSFEVPAGRVNAAGKALSLVRYDEDRDEWRVVVPTVAMTGGRAQAPIVSTGSYALVYADASSPALAAGAALPAAADPCATTPCPLLETTLTLDPEVVLPDESAVASLVIDGSTVPFPSGTAAQAWIDEQLTLADGTLLLDPPFAADLILYRTLEGTEATAVFRLAPSRQASEVILASGIDRVRVRSYPGRLARGALVGPEGGRVPSDEHVSVEIPPGATLEPLRASASWLAPEELASQGPIAGFRVLGGLALELEPIEETAADADGDGVSDAHPGVRLAAPARVTFRVDGTAVDDSTQVIVAELIGASLYGRRVRLASRTEEIRFEGTGAKLFTTTAVDRSALPLDGVVREGRYIFLAADSPVAFATGSVRRGDAGPYLDAALLSALPLGVEDVSRRGGLFAIPVPAAPAQPFTIFGRHAAIGEGAPYAAESSPEKNAIVALGDLHLESQPPVIASTVPSNGATGVSLTTTVRVQFDRALDPTSVGSGSIVVSGPSGVVAGTATLEGNSAVVWSMAPGGSLAAGSFHTVRVSSEIRSSAGAPLGTAFSFSFATLSVLASGEVHPERISIEIPDPSGAATVRGGEGALPAGWQALAVRRARDFVTRYQATADGNGAFELVAGGCGSATASCADRISLADSIDLHVINASGNLAAIVPLTPFVNAEGTGFIAGAREETTFTSRDGIGVRVPAGAFGQPVLVTVVPAPKGALDEVPGFESELRWSGSVEMTFDCTGAELKPCMAQERIGLEVPAPAGAPQDRIYLLGLLGQSVRGPRVMVVDTLRIQDGKFTTRTAGAAGPGAASTRLAAGVEVQGDVKTALLGAVIPGIYSVIDVAVAAGSSFAWSQMDVPGGAYELFIDTLVSLYASSLYLAESRGRVTIPILTGKPFTITGYDAATGLEAFKKAYDPNSVADPGAIFVEGPPVPNEHGPYPVFGTPFRIESLDVDLEGIDLPRIRNFTVRLEGGVIKVSDALLDALPPAVPVTLINPSSGALDTTRGDGLEVPGARGDRVVLLVREEDVDAATGLSVVFNEAIGLDGATSPDAIDAFLKTRFKLEHRPRSATAASPFTDVTHLARFTADSGRRVTVQLPAVLQIDALYRLRIGKDLADASGLKILEVQVEGATKGGLASDLVLEFTTGAPGGSIGAIELRQDATTQLGTIRDLALDGNVMYVSALEGGLVAYDVSNPVAMTSTTLPLSYVPGTLDAHWSAAADHHGRIYAAALGTTFGVIRTFRAEQFLRQPEQTEPHTVDQQIAGGIVSWAPGYSSALPASTVAVLSDRPEAIPRKVQVLVQDDDDPLLERDAFKQSWSSMIAAVEELGGGIERLTLSLPIDGSLPYLLQRVTVENATAALRVSDDARIGAPASIEIVAGRRDRLRVIRNQRTYGVVSLFGYGVGILDLNALESNDAPAKPAGWKALRERIALTRASIEPDDSLSPTWDVGDIPDLSFTPDAAILPGGGGPNVLALDARRGVLDLPVRPQPTADGTFTLGAVRGGNAGLVFRGTLGNEAYDHPRLVELRAKFNALAGREPTGRFTSIAPFRWTLDGAENAPVVPEGTYGERGSQAGANVTRDYALVAGNEYGILVVEAGGDAPLGLPHEPLAQQSLVDVVWIPAGAAAVRTIPGWHLAAVIDGSGHLLLIDLSRVDERFGADGAPVLPGTDLFPTAAAALGAKGAYGVGRPDPRILWRSETPVAAGTLAPLVDPRTGLVFAGRLLEKGLQVIAALDPRLRVLVDLGAAWDAATALQETPGAK